MMNLTFPSKEKKGCRDGFGRMFMIIGGAILLGLVVFLLSPMCTSWSGPCVPPKPTWQVLLMLVTGDRKDEGKFCGGFVAGLPENQCPLGYYCKMDGEYTDASGQCSKDVGGLIFKDDVGKTRCDGPAEYPKDGKCPPGCVNYGVPLGCVTEDFYNYCQQEGVHCVQ